ncbi:MAG: bifunctional isocitrate dehydrogenase kinase/phosphatase, partial [Zoogloea sp.]|nr:bifunctional isocitrate dehydrogenase kinase/phosphatase [Zoogloea sp.]
METQASENPIAQAIAQAMIEGFNKHYRIFRETSRRAKELYEAADWQGQLTAVRDRVQFYDDRVDETVHRLREEFDADSVDDATWQSMKLHYIGMLINHKQPELAETFFNSVCSKIFHRTYFNNDYIFTRPTISTEYIECYPPVYSSYYPRDEGLRATVRTLIEDFDWQRPFEDLDRDVDHIMQALRRYLGEWPNMEVNCQIQVLYSAFYRNKTAYILGKAINGYQEYPFVLAVRHSESGMLHIDTILLETWRISLLFSLSRAYFMVDMEVPSGYVQFLRSIMPNKPRSELYTMLGLGKQGKTMFFRDLIAHLRHSNDQFIVAPGIRGLVMLVFTLPSFPYVFKIIKDVFGSSKNMDRATVKKKYLMVKQVDRVGRMADTLEFSNVALPRSRFDPELIAELKQLAPSVLEEDGDTLVIKHLY